ncbi:hypothetical protein [Nocardioides sp.]|uniref:calcium-binding protein n=1 Tax=Nocardioides sp. TaxID=35761 RepID=UPI002CAFC943|nr:hypothetical protein [Nocardioides sp.]HXH81230.1 hypothetical protein [Nocardioides sp.]
MALRAAVASLVTLSVLMVSVLIQPALPSSAATGPCAAPTISGTPADDVLLGTPGADVIDGLDGDDEIDGLGGDDVICGSAGADSLDGGEGSDRLHGGTDSKVAIRPPAFDFVGDTLTGGPGDDLLDPGADPRAGGSNDVLSFRGSTAGVVLDLPGGAAVGEGTDQVVGEVLRVLASDHDDVLVGTDEDQQLFGFGGGDHIDGGGGDDYIGGADNAGLLSDTVGNVLLGGPGSDSLHGSDGDDVARGGPGQDQLNGGGGLDQLGGGPSQDTVSDTALSGKGQVVSGGAGRDQLYLYFGHDGQRLLRNVVAHVDLGAGTARAKAGSVTVRLRVPGFEHINATDGKRWFVRGTNGPDTIYTHNYLPIVAQGLGGNDTFAGSLRADVLDGGPGRDRAYGQPDRDDRYISVEQVP